MGAYLQLHPDLLKSGTLDTPAAPFMRLLIGSIEACHQLSILLLLPMIMEELNCSNKKSCRNLQIAWKLFSHSPLATSLLQSLFDNLPILLLILFAFRKHETHILLVPAPFIHYLTISHLILTYLACIPYKAEDHQSYQK